MALVKAGALLFPLILLGCEERPSPKPAPGQACRNVLIKPVERRVLRWTSPQAPAPPLPCDTALCVCGTRHLLARSVDDAKHLRVEGAEPGPLVVKDAHCRDVIGGNQAFGIKGDTALRVVSPERGLEPRALPLPAIGPKERPAGLYVEGETLTLVLRQTHGAHERRDVRLRGPALPPRRPVLDEEERVVGHLFTEAGHSSLELGGERRALPEGALTGLASRHAWRAGPFTYAGLGRRVLVIPDEGAPFFVEDGLGQVFFGSRSGPYRITDESVERFSAAGPTLVVERRPGRDLTGAKLDEGTTLENTIVYPLKPWNAVLFIDRYRLQTCEQEDRVHLLELPSGDVSTLADGPGMRSHPRLSLGTLHVVESDLSFELVSLSR